jgi:hypothetical protein
MHHKFRCIYNGFAPSQFHGWEFALILRLCRRKGMRRNGVLTIDLLFAALTARAKFFLLDEVLP